MSGLKKNSKVRELSIPPLKDAEAHAADADSQEIEEITIAEEGTSTNIEGLVHQEEKEEVRGFLLSTENMDYDDATKTEFEGTRTLGENPDASGYSSKQGQSYYSLDDSNEDLPGAVAAIQRAEPPLPMPQPVAPQSELQSQEKTEIVNEIPSFADQVMPPSDLDKTVAVAGYQIRPESNLDDKVKVSVGQNRASSGYQGWNKGGSTESNLGQAENLRMAQEKILELEQENEKLRLQNEEFMAASEIIKERSDLLSAQLNEYKNDRDGLEDSFKNEIVLLKSHLARKDTELRRAQFKNEELDSRLKFDMKKIRIRERELENRLELIRAEKNAIVKNKDEQILDLKRKMDVLQMEVESYRQKCVDLNKSIESSQESFKRTTRALRLAMANLELQEENKAENKIENKIENKVPLKKVD